MDKHSVIFDFDGVIADSFDAAYLSAKAICKTLVSEDHYRELFSRNIYESMDDPGAHTKDCNHELFYDFLPDHMTKLAKPYDGIHDSMDLLSQNFNLHIVTSNATKVVTDFIQKYDFAGMFGEILGYEVSKSKVEKMKILRKLHGVQQNALFVTDTVGDIKEAAKIGHPSVAVTWGYCDEPVLLEAAPNYIARSPLELTNTITQYYRSL